jgi:hypothetical protein
MARGGHGLYKVSSGPAMPYSSSPVGKSPETAKRSFQGWPARRVGGLSPSSTLFDTPRCTPMIPFLSNCTVGNQWPSDDLVMTSFPVEIMSMTGHVTVLSSRDHLSMYRGKLWFGIKTYTNGKVKLLRQILPPSQPVHLKGENRKATDYK